MSEKDPNPYSNLIRFLLKLAGSATLKKINSLFKSHKSNICAHRKEEKGAGEDL